MENSLMNSLDYADLFHYIRQIDIFPWLKKFSKTVEFPNLDIAYTRHLCSDDILWIDGVEKNWFIKVNICEKVNTFFVY